MLKTINRDSRIGLALIGLTLFMPVSHADTFDLDTLAGKAEKLAKEPYQPPQQVPQFLRDLSFSQHREMRFKPDMSLWHESGSDFQAMMLLPGSYYSNAVDLYQIDREGVHPIGFDKNDFTYTDDALAKRIPADLGYAGFKLTYPLNASDTQNQFLVFAGATYFRGVGRDQHFGLSARGIAIDTGLTSGEEVPLFRSFWMERPNPDAKSMVVYGLLDGASLTGAYRFRIHPGDTTEIEVTARLFFRKNVQMAGMAPLTSMFYYGENTIRPVGEWRPQVHDSDGLLVHDGASGEWLWRPLINPSKLRMSYLQTDNVRGFGLLQRDTDFASYEDSEARYDNRPSAWVETEGDWGKGSVVLVEIPTNAEINDNIVAFWKSDKPVKAGDTMTLKYKLGFGPASMPEESAGRAMQTFVGDGNRIGGGSVDGAYRVIVDFNGGKLKDLKPDASVVSKVTGDENTEVLEHFVEYLPTTGSWRLSMLVRPAKGQMMSLRAFLSMGDKPLTETWTYKLPADTDIRAASK